MERKKVKNEVIVIGIYEQFWEKKIKKNDRLISKVERKVEHFCPSQKSSVVYRTESQKGQM